MLIVSTVTYVSLLVCLFCFLGSRGRFLPVPKRNKILFCAYYRFGKTGVFPV